MSNQFAAEKAAKALAEQLKIPSWQGGVSVWMQGGAFSLRVFVEPSWVNRMKISIPEEFQGFKVEVDLPIRGTAQKFKLAKYA